MVAAKAYRFISPVFSYDKTGQVLELLNAALTNTPAVDGMEEVLLAAASLMAAHLTTEGQTEMDEEFLNELLSNLRWMLNLPTASTKEEIMSKIKVKAASGLSVPREDNARRYITDAEPLEVENTAYYQRQVMAGDLIIVTSSDKNAKSKNNVASTEVNGEQS